MTGQANLDRRREIVQLIKTIIDPMSVFNLLGIKVYSQSSSEIRSKCPFHNGKNKTSFRFNKLTGQWLCFSQHCHEGSGDIFGLVMKRMQVTFPEALSFLADLSGIDLEEDLFSVETENLIKEAEIINFINRKKKKKNTEIVYDESLLKKLNEVDSSYFFIRDGFSEEVLKYFEVGGTYIDPYGEIRVAIPIRNTDGDLVMITGRKISNDIDPRYLPLEPGFNKGNILYNYWQVKPIIPIYNGLLFVVEGFKGCWKTVQNGLPNTVACMGSTLTHDQVKLTFGNIDIREIILMLDGDLAGQKGTEKSKEEIEFGSKLTTIKFPNDLDPSMIDHEWLFDFLRQYNNKNLSNLLTKIEKEKDEYERKQGRHYGVGMGTGEKGGF
jgi:DNA primase